MDGNGGSGDAEFDSFVSTGDVEGDFSNAGGQDDAGAADDSKAKPVAKRGPPREAKIETTKGGVSADDPADGAKGGEEGEEDDNEGGEEGDDKPQKTARDHQIERLKREKADLNKRLRALEGGAGTATLASRLEAVENRLTGGNDDDTKNAGKTPAPDPSDTDKYPLGHLDDRYIEDKLAWLAKGEATKLADAALLRQQERERTQSAEQAQTALLEKVDTLAVKGSEQFEDFQEAVVDAGMRGDWDLTQTTFEAAHDAENGAQILYELSQDTKEATRVAKLSPIQQLKFVLERDTAISAGKKGRTKPGAGKPPENTARGANSKTQINPATDNLDDFEKQWEREAKGKK